MWSLVGNFLRVLGQGMMELACQMAWRLVETWILGQQCKA